MEESDICNLLHFVAGMLLIAMLCSKGMAQCQYTVQIVEGFDCQVTGLNPILANEINELGVVVGEVWVCQGGTRAYSWSEETGIVLLQQPNIEFNTAAANDVSDAGIVVGLVPQTQPNSGGFEAAMWVEGELQRLGVDSVSECESVNEAQQIVGYYNNSDTGPIRPLLWEKGRLEFLDLPLEPHGVGQAINNGGTITGWMGPAVFNGGHAFVWTRQSVIDLGVIPGGFASEGKAINDVGQVAGAGLLHDEEGRTLRRGFMWSEDEMKEVTPLPGYLESVAYDINVFGQVVGDSSNPSDELVPHFAAMMWIDGVSYDLNELAELPPDVRLTSARAVNDRGQIATAADWHNDIIVALLTPADQPLGDVNVDCRTNEDDLSFVIQQWGKIDSPADIDLSGTVDVDDLLVVLMSWTR